MEQQPCPEENLFMHRHLKANIGALTLIFTSVICHVQVLADLYQQEMGDYTSDGGSIIFDSEVDVTARDEHGETLLHVAARWNTNPEVIKNLIASGAKVDSRSNSGVTPLHVAAVSNGNPAIVEILLQAGAELDAKDEAGRTPLHYAAWQSDNPIVIEALLKAAVDVNAIEATGWTPLHMAARNNSNPIILETLIQAGAKLDARDNENQTPLHEAAWGNGNEVVIDTLLKAGSDVNAREKDDWTPLHFSAAFNNNPAAIDTLVNAGADVNAHENDGWTPLHLAAQNNDNPEMIQKLLGLGAELESLNSQKQTPLLVAVRSNENSAVLDLLLAAGADMNARDSKGWTALHLAARDNSNPAVITALISAELKVNEQAGNDETPLHLAAWSNSNPEVVKLLLEHGADIEAKDKWGELPWENALQNNERLRNNDVYQRLLPPETVLPTGMSSGAPASAALEGVESAVPPGFHDQALALRQLAVERSDEVLQVLRLIPGVNWLLPQDAPEDERDIVLKQLWGSFFENVIVEVRATDKTTPSALYYNPLLDVALLTHWEQDATTAYRLSGLRVAPGERFSAAGAMVPAAPGWMNGSAPIDILYDTNMERLTVFRRSSLAEHTGDADQKYEQAVRDLKAAQPRLEWNASQRIAWHSEANTWLSETIDTIEDTIALGDEAELIAKASETDAETAGVLVSLPSGLVDQLTLDIVLTYEEEERLLVISLPDDGDFFIMVKCRIDTDARRCTPSQYILVGLESDAEQTT